MSHRHYDLSAAGVIIHVTEMHSIYYFKQMGLLLLRRCMLWSHCVEISNIAL